LKLMMRMARVSSWLTGIFANNWLSLLFYLWTNISNCSQQISCCHGKKSCQRWLGGLGFSNE
jgi:hypothetical protein